MRVSHQMVAKVMALLSWSSWGVAFLAIRETILVILSTAEAEMMEVIEGMVAGESVLVMASEIFKGVARKVWTDSQSAQAILCLEGGSWRTRHLRIRATAARQAFTAC